ncbi:MAG: hypothetical protein GF330_03840 [Candidatus Eisenbacteria bacterium]|nr:hypothetical protein [Candidatus Eisenbacteria bacterium]
MPRRCPSRLPIGLAAALLLAVPAAAAPPARQIIPPPAEDLAWVGETAIYRGDALFEYINGAAPQFIEYGFEEVASQELTFGGHTYIFDVYRMRDPLAAFGIWSTRRSGTAPPIADLPRSSYTPYQGMIARGAYLIEIVAYESAPETPGEMAELIRRGTAGLAEELLAADPLAHPPLSRLPAEGRAPASVKLAAGPVSLRIALGPQGQGLFYEMLSAIDETLSDPLWGLARYPVAAETDAEGVDLSRKVVLLK